MLAPGHTPVCRRSHVSAAQPPISVSRCLFSCGTRDRAWSPPGAVHDLHRPRTGRRPHGA